MEKENLLENIFDTAEKKMSKTQRKQQYASYVRWILMNKKRGTKHKK